MPFAKFSAHTILKLIHINIWFLCFPYNKEQVNSRNSTYIKDRHIYNRKTRARLSSKKIQPVLLAMLPCAVHEFMDKTENCRTAAYADEK